MKNVNLFRGRTSDVTNFDVSDAQKQTDGTITADLWCTHGAWDAEAVFNEDGSVELDLGSDKKLYYDSYEVVS